MPEWQTRWLKGTPCSPPCWEGVTPGQTSAQNAAAIVRASPVLTNVNVYAAGALYYGSIDWTWACSHRGGGLHYDIFGPLHVVTRIEPSYPEPFALAEVIQAYGEPSHVVARRLDNVEVQETGRDIYDLDYVYLPLGFDLYQGSSYTKPTLSEKQEFSKPLFFAPTPEGFSQGTGIPGELLVPWQGFKDFQTYCIDERERKPWR